MSFDFIEQMPTGLKADFPKLSSGDEAERLAFEQYLSAVKSKQIALDVLERLVQHDEGHLDELEGAEARMLVLLASTHGGIPNAKHAATAGDFGFGERWPIPPSFSKSCSVQESK